MDQDNSKTSDKKERRNSPFDRRSGKDRRKAYKLGYFQDGGIERRSGKERRLGKDRRSGGVGANESPDKAFEEQENGES